MKSNNRIVALGLAVVLAASASSLFAQNPNDPQKTRERTTTPAQDNTKKTKPATGERLEPDDTARTPGDVPAETQANRHEQISEESAVVTSYDNFFTTYRLGPEDVISVVVFNQDRYSRAGIVIPPSGRINLSLMPGGIFVNGKTVDEVAEMIKKRYDEYIIDPQVSVSLDKASSYRFSILGDVAQPGIRPMSHRMTVTEAIAEAGGVLQTGKKSGVVVLRRQSDGQLARIPVNVSAMYEGKAPDNVFLVPGDQILVPGNTLKKIQSIMGLVQVASFARVFTGGW